MPFNASYHFFFIVCDEKITTDVRYPAVSGMYLDGTCYRKKDITCHFPGETKMNAFRIRSETMKLEDIRCGFQNTTLQWRHNEHDGVSMVCSDADQRKHQSSTSLAFVRGIHQWPVTVSVRSGLYWHNKTSMLALAAKMSSIEHMPGTKQQKKDTFRVHRMGLTLYPRKRKFYKIISNISWHPEHGYY